MPNTLRPINWRLFRSMVWYRALKQTKAGQELIKSELRSNELENSKLQFKWARGEVAATKRSACRFSAIEGSLNVFDLEVFPLLDTNRTPTTLKQYFNDHIFESWGSTWYFEEDAHSKLQIPLTEKLDLSELIDMVTTGIGLPSRPSVARDDSEQLAVREDLNGFTAILALIREAEVKRDLIAHTQHFANLYRILPTICALPLFSAFGSELTQLVQTIQARVEYR